MKLLYKFRKDIYKDAWNWWDACNHSSHGMVWKNQVNDNLANKLIGKTKKEANKTLIPFLKKVYVDQEKKISKTKTFFKNEFDHKFQKGCNRIVKIMGKPIYRYDFTFYLTTMKRCPYYKPRGAIWLCVFWNNPMEVFLHELCHFQFIHYWRENPKSKVSRLSDEQFEFLKESLTIILDEDFMPIISRPDKGYDLHQDFRKELKKFWKKNKDFDKLVDFGVENISKYFIQKI